MGYRSDFEITVYNHDGTPISEEDTEALANALQEVSGYDNDYGEAYITVTDAKWYEWVDHLRQISEMLPFYPLRIQCIAKGEDGEQAIVYAHKGKVQSGHAEVIFPPCELWGEPS